MFWYYLQTQETHWNNIKTLNIWFSFIQNYQLLHLNCKRMSVAGNETDLNFVLSLVEAYDSVFLEFRALQKMTENTWLYF